MIKEEVQKTYYTSNVIVDVTCDDCGISLISDDQFINRVEAGTLYFLEGRPFLESSGFHDYKLDLCDNCYKPIEELLNKIENKRRERNR